MAFCPLTFLKKLFFSAMAFSFLKKSYLPQVQIDKAPADGIEAFKKFYDADTLEEILEYFEQVCVHANIEKGGRFIEFFPYLKAAYLVKAAKN